MGMEHIDSDGIARLFAARLPAHGGWISVKQVTWLHGTWKREIVRQFGHAPTRESRGVLCAECGTSWDLWIAPNGAGTLKTQPCAHRPCQTINCTHPDCEPAPVPAKTAQQSIDEARAAGVTEEIIRAVFDRDFAAGVVS